MSRHLLMVSILGAICAAAVATSCDDETDTPLPNLQEAGTITIQLAQMSHDGTLTTAVEDGLLGAGGAAGVSPDIPADAAKLQFFVLVSASAGSWSITVTADGALGVSAPGDTSSASEKTFTSSGTTPTQVMVPLAVTSPAGGNAAVHVTLGDVVHTYPFFVTPAAYSAEEICLALFNAGVPSCVPDDSLTPDPDNGAGGATAFDGGLQFRVASPKWLHYQGEQGFALIDPGAAGAGPGLVAGQELAGVVTASGSLSLLVESKPVQSVPIALEQTGLSTPLLPIQFTSTGVGTLAVQLGDGTARRKNYVSGTPVIAPRRVVITGTGGSPVTDILTVCTSAPSGTITATVTDNAGTVTTPTVDVITARAITACPPGLPGEASFGWTGTQQFPVWTFSLDAGGIKTTTVVQMAGFSAPAKPPTFACLNASPATVLEWAVVPPSSADGEGGSANSGPGTLIVDLDFTVFDCSAASMPLPGVTFSVAGTAGLTPTSPTVTTDPTGRAVIELRGTAVSINEAVAVLSSGKNPLVTVTGLKP